MLLSSGLLSSILKRSLSFPSFGRCNLFERWELRELVKRQASDRKGLGNPQTSWLASFTCFEHG